MQPCTHIKSVPSLWMTNLADNFCQNWSHGGLILAGGPILAQKWCKEPVLAGYSAKISLVGPVFYQFIKFKAIIKCTRALLYNYIEASLYNLNWVSTSFLLQVQERHSYKNSSTT